MNNYLVYMLLCQRKDGLAFYTGITNDWDRRWDQHITGQGAKFTRAFKPIEGMVYITGLTRSHALKMEISVKKLPAEDKQKLWDAMKKSKGNHYYIEVQICPRCTQVVPRKVQKEKREAKVQNARQSRLKAIERGHALGRKPRQVDEAKIIEMRQNLMSLRAIAKALDVSTTTIQRVILKHRKDSSTITVR